MANIYHQRMLERRKANKLCRECGKPLDRDGIRCIECNNKHNLNKTKDRIFYQSIGICPRCRAEKIYGEEKVCIECKHKLTQEVLATRNKETYNKNHAEWSRKTHKLMVEQGICYRCRKRKADFGYKTCGICRTKLREYRREKDYKCRRNEQGLCYYCNEPVKQGYKICEKHYQSNLYKTHSEKAVQARRGLSREYYANYIKGKEEKNVRTD